MVKQAERIFGEDGKMDVETFRAFAYNCVSGRSGMGSDRRRKKETCESAELH